MSGSRQTPGDKYVQAVALTRGPGLGGNADGGPGGGMGKKEGGGQGAEGLDMEMD